jgi:dipeptidyl aminopeptidase/acylaminoacyl peptidase
VPPNQAEALVEALRREGKAVGYFLFSGEQHGFRHAANIKCCLDAELQFYCDRGLQDRLNVLDIGLTF